MALQMVARLMGKSLLDDCARAVPAFALIYVENRLDGAMFSACAAAEPLLALYICAERLTDDELVRHTKGRGAELKELLADPSKRSLILKLMPLLGRLDPDVESVVALASAPEI